MNIFLKVNSLKVLTIGQALCIMIRQTFETAVCTLGEVLKLAEEAPLLRV
jgi:hypothetical protein